MVLGLVVHPLGVGEGWGLAPGVAVPQAARSSAAPAAVNAVLVVLTPL